MILEEAVRDLSLFLGAGASTTDNLQLQGHRHGAVNAINKLLEKSIEIPEEALDEIQSIINRYVGGRGNGGFANPGD